MCKERMREMYKWGVLLAGIVAVLGWSALSETEPKKKVFHTTEEIIQAIQTRDPFYYTRLAVDDILFEYTLFYGRYASLKELRQAGFDFLDLQNPFTGEPLEEECEKFKPGAVCIELDGPYRLINVWIQDASGVFRGPSFGPAQKQNGNFYLEIPPEVRDKKGGTPYYRSALQLGYDDLKLRLIALGQVMMRQLFGGPVSRYPTELKTLEEQLTFAYGFPPYNRIKDPVTGNVLSFTPSGYGERIKFERGQFTGGVRIKVLLNNEVIMEGEVFQDEHKQVRGRLFVPPPLRKTNPA
ncbi:MAG: hypothetical protein V2G33_05590 [bacterium JZ-2024 1]